MTAGAMLSQLSRSHQIALRGAPRGQTKRRGRVSGWHLSITSAHLPTYRRRRRRRHRRHRRWARLSATVGTAAEGR